MTLACPHLRTMTAMWYTSPWSSLCNLCHMQTGHTVTSVWLSSRPLCISHSCMCNLSMHGTNFDDAISDRNAHLGLAWHRGVLHLLATVHVDCLPVTVTGLSLTAASSAYTPVATSTGTGIECSSVCIIIVRCQSLHKGECRWPAGARSVGWTYGLPYTLSGLPYAEGHVRLLLQVCTPADSRLSASRQLISTPFLGNVATAADISSQ